MQILERAESQAASGVEVTIVIRNELGLHGRPAAKLTQVAQQFEGRITLEYEGMTADARSILDILSLAAGKDASITVRCHGEDAALAAETIRAVLSGDEGC